MIKACFLIFTIFMSDISIVWADIYKWTDSDGTIHYSDSPNDRAKSVTLPPAQTFTTSEQKTLTPQKNEKSVEKVSKKITILQPKPEETIRNNQGFIPIVAEVTPEFGKADLLQVLLDGKPMSEPKHTVLFALNEVDRGTHVIEIQLVDKNKEVIATSERVTIYLHRPRVGMVPATRNINRPAT